MSLILLLKILEVETGLYKISRFDTPRFPSGVFETEVTVALGAIHKLRYAIEVGGWSAKYNYCNIYKVDM